MLPWKPTPDEYKAMQMKIEPLGFVEMAQVSGRAAVADASSHEVLQFVTRFDLEKLWWMAKGWDEQLHSQRQKREEPREP